MEIWKDVVGFEGLYAVSNEGRLKSLERTDRFGRKLSNKIISTKKNNRGYVQVHLCKDGKKYTKLLHRVVAEAFVPNPKRLPQINHKDENKENNSAENLEWCDNLYNRRYGTGYQRSCEKHNYKKMAEKRKKKVSQKTLDGELVAIHPSAIQAGKSIGKSDSNIRRCCYGKYKQAYGYVWEYIT